MFAVIFYVAHQKRQSNLHKLKPILELHLLHKFTESLFFITSTVSAVFKKNNLFSGKPNIKEL